MHPTIHTDPVHAVLPCSALAHALGTSDPDTERLSGETGAEIVHPDTEAGILETPVSADLADGYHGISREMFTLFRSTVGPAESGNAVVV